MVLQPNDPGVRAFGYAGDAVPSSTPIVLSLLRTGLVEVVGR